MRRKRINSVTATKKSETASDESVAYSNHFEVMIRNDVGRVMGIGEVTLPSNCAIARKTARTWVDY